MSKKFFAVIMAALMMVSFMPALAFASDEAEFDTIRGCRIMSYVEPIRDSRYASQLDLSMVDETIKALETMRYDHSKSYDDNMAAVFGCCSKLYENLFNQYKVITKKSIEKLGEGADANVAETTKSFLAKLDSVQYAYDQDLHLEEHLAPLDLVVNNCNLSIYNLTNASKIKAAKITQKNPSADKKGKIKVKFGVKSVGDAKIAQYQIYRSTSKNFKKGLKKITVKISDPTQSTVTYTDSKGLKKGKKYYYKVRGVVDGKTYTKWSGIKSIKRK